MNKDKIKKGLECCNVEVSCNDCPYFKEAHCNDALSKDALNLITEQENEIERLRQEVRDTDKMSSNSIEQYKNDFDKAFYRIRAQQQEIYAWIEMYKELRDELWDTQQEKIDAVKEFAERLKEKSYVNDYCREIVEIEKIDELLKEYEK